MTQQKKKKKVFFCSLLTGHTLIFRSGDVAQQVCNVLTSLWVHGEEFCVCTCVSLICVLLCDAVLCRYTYEDPYSTQIAAKNNLYFFCISWLLKLFFFKIRNQFLSKF